MTMEKALGKRFLSGVTSALLAVTYALPSGVSPLLNAAADEVAADGAPIVSGPYEDTMWYRGNPLGIAGDFHLFAFDSITTPSNQSHINGNIATPNYILGGNHAQMNKKGAGRLLNVVRDSISFVEGEDYEKDMKTGEGLRMSLGDMSDFFFPESYDISVADWMGNESYPGYPANTMMYGFVKVKIKDGGGNEYSPSYYLKIMPGGNASKAYIAHPAEKFIDFEGEKLKYENKSKEYAAISKDDICSDFEWKYDPDDEWGEGEPTGSVLTLNSAGLNVLNLTATDLALDKYRFVDVKNINFSDGQYLDDQTLVVNINLEEKDYVEWKPQWTYESASDPNYKLVDSESSVFNGTNIIYNFYNAAEGGTHVDFAKEDSLEPIGCVIAPDCEFETGNMSGTIVADKIIVFNETHMAPFKNPVSAADMINISAKKVWSDGSDSHNSDEVEVALYRTNKGGLDNVLTELALDKRYDDALDVIAGGTMMSSFSYGEGMNRKTVTADKDAKTITFSTMGGFGGEGSSDVVFSKSGDGITSELEDGTYALKRGVGGMQKDITFTVADGMVTAGRIHGNHFPSWTVTETPITTTQ